MPSGPEQGLAASPFSLPCDTLGLLCCRLVIFPTKNTISNCLPTDGEEGPCCSVSLGVSLLLWCGLVLHSLFGVAAPSARLLWWVRRMVTGEIPTRFSGADDDDICGCHSPPWRRHCATFFSSPWSLVCGWKPRSLRIGRRRRSHVASLLKALLLNLWLTPVLIGWVLFLFTTEW
jgi:hypothetical protein